MSSIHPPLQPPPATATSLGVSIVGYEAALKREMGRVATGESPFSVVLSSPRSLAACLNVGLTPEELRPLSRREHDQRHPVLPSLLQLRLPSSPKASPLSSTMSPRSSSPTIVTLPPEAQDKIYQHYQSRLFEKVELVKEQRRHMIMKARGEEGYHFLLLDDDDDEGGTHGTSSSSVYAHGAGSLDPTVLARALASPPRNVRRHGQGGEKDEKEPPDVELRAAYLKSAMMEMETRRIEGKRKRWRVERCSTENNGTHPPSFPPFLPQPSRSARRRSFKGWWRERKGPS